jgi:hypothetical protein
MRVNIMPLTSIEQVRQLKPWLESFDHHLPDPITGQFHLFTKGERVLALTQQAQLNVLFPAVNPKVVTPRETREIVDCFHAWSSIMPNGLKVSVPHDSPMHKHMAKLGYKPKAIIYESVP